VKTVRQEAVMKKLSLIAWLLIAVQLSSCATKSLWDSTSPDHYKRVRADLVPEEEVKKKELPYFKGSDGKSFYVKKTGSDRVWDYTLRVFGTPVAVVMDAAYIVLFIGTLGLVSGIAPYAGELKEEGDCKYSTRCNKNYHAEELATQATDSFHP